MVILESKNGFGEPMGQQHQYHVSVAGSGIGDVEGRVENFSKENKKKAWGDVLKGW